MSRRRRAGPRAGQLGAVVLAVALARVAAAETEGPHLDFRRPSAAPLVGARAPALGVLEYGPTGAVAMQRPELKVRFDRPVVSFVNGQALQARAPLVTTPPLPGRARWAAPDLLVFEAESIPAATSFAVELRGPIVADTGERFAGPLRWRFETPRPRCERLGPDAPHDLVGRLGPGEAILFECTQAPLRRGLDDWVRVSAAGRPVAVQVGLLADLPAAAADADPLVTGPLPWLDRVRRLQDGRHRERVVVVRPAVRWPAGARLSVQVSRDLRGGEGPLSMDEPLLFEESVVPPPALRGVRCHADALEALLATCLDPDAFEAVTRGISPPPPPLLEETLPSASKRTTIQTPRCGFFDGARTMALGPGRAGTTYDVTLPAGSRDEHGQTVERASTMRVDCPVPPPTVQLDSDPGILEARKPLTIGVAAHGPTETRVRAVVLDADTLRARAPRWWHDGEWAEAEAGPRPTGDEDDRERVLRAVPLAQIGPPVLERVLPLARPGLRGWSSTAFDLGTLLAGARRPVLVELEGAAGGDPGQVKSARRALFEVTDLGLVGWTSQVGGRAAIQAVQLSTGRPLSGVTIATSSDGGPLRPIGTTDARGLAWMAARADMASLPAGSLLLANTAGDRDIALLRFQPDAWDAPLEAPAPGGLGLRPGERLVGVVFPERDLFLPGETIHFVGYAAMATPFQDRGLRAVPAGTAARVQLARGQDGVAEARVTIDERGKLWGTLRLPSEASPGSYHLSARILAGATATRPGPARLPGRLHDDEEDDEQSDDSLVGTAVTIAAYRNAEMTVTARPQQADVNPDARVKIAVEARRKYGGAATLGRVEATLRCWPGDQPSGGEGWTVGVQETSRRMIDEDRRPRPLAVPLTREEAARGRARISIAARAWDAHHPASCEVLVIAHERSLRTAQATASFTVHPARYYLGLRAPTFWPPGRSVRVGLVALGVRGRQIAATDVTVRVERRDSQVVQQAQVARLRPDRPAEVRLGSLQPGSYRLVAEARDGTRTVRAARTIEVRRSHGWPGTDQTEEAGEDEDQSDGLSVQAPESAPVGEQVRIHVRAHARRGPASGLLAVLRDGLREVYPLRFEGGRAVVSLSVDERWVPTVTLEAVAVLPGTGAPARMVSGRATIGVAPAHRRLRVSVKLPAEARPGTNVEASVAVRDPGGRPVPHARLAVFAVDEGVLALTSYAPPDPLDHFAPEPQFETTLLETLSRGIAPYTPREIESWGTIGKGGSGYGRGAGGLGGRRSSRPGALRDRFETTPLFIGDVSTDDQGVARVRVPLPHSLTAFRVTAVASAALAGAESDPPARFGAGHAQVRVNLPLSLRPLVARSLRPGDQSEAAVIAHNRSARPGTLVLTLGLATVHGELESPTDRGIDAGAASVVQLANPSSFTARLAAGEDRRFAVALVAKGPGQAALRWTARFTPAGGGASEEDAVQLPIAVVADDPPRELVAASARVAGGERLTLPVRLPAAAARPEAQGQLLVRASSSTAADIEGIARWLLAYRHGCVEQSSSRFVPFVAVPGQAERLSGKAAGERAEELLARLARFERSHGRGLGYWPGEERTTWFGTAWATLVLGRATRAKLLQPSPLLERLRFAITTWLTEGSPPKPSVGGNTRAPRPTAATRALLALALAESGAPASGQVVTALVAEAPALSVEGLSFLALAISRVDASDPRLRPLLASIASRARESVRAAHFDSPHFDPDLPVASASLTEAVALWAFERGWPAHPLAAKLARGLRDHRRGNSWGSTLENALALLALAERPASPAAPAPLSGFVSFGGAAVSATLPLTLLLSRASAPLGAIERRLPLAQLPVEMFAASGPPSSLELRAAGPGTMDFALEASFVPPDVDSAANQGLGVATTFRLPLGERGPGEPIAAAGSLVAIDVSVATRAVSISHVVIDVPVPAGLEPLDPVVDAETIASSGAFGLEPRRGLPVRRLEVHADRVFLYLSDLRAGTHEGTFYARALSPGRYRVPGARAEAMYDPELRGRATAGIFQVAAPP